MRYLYLYLGLLSLTSERVSFVHLAPIIFKQYHPATDGDYNNVPG